MLETSTKVSDDWMIIAYFDGRDVAYNCVLYSRYETKPGCFEVNFVAGKAKVTSSGVRNTPRAELDGDVLITRVLVRVLHALDEKPTKVVIAGDSKTVLADRVKTGRCFSEYLVNRLGETWDN